MKTDIDQAWVARDEAIIAPFQRVSYYPVAVASGKGATLTDMDGNTYIDWLASAGSANTGHAHPDVVAAIEAQTRAISQYTNAYFYNAIASEFAEALAAVAPGDFPKKVAFGLSGSDGIDGAIKIVRAFTGRERIITFQGNYHGSTFGALSLTHISLNMRRKLGATLPGVTAFPFPDPYRDGPDSGARCLAAIERAFETYVPPEEVAAVFVEPLQGDGGLIVPPVDFIQGLYALCKRHGILFVSDEIQQGCMRTGKWLGIEHFGVVPDLAVMGKSVGGGLPLSAIVGRAEVMDALEAPAHLFTMAANATCCAAGLASLKVLTAPGFQADVVRRSDKLRRGLEKLGEKYPFVGEIRGIGFSIGMEIVADKAAKTPDIDGAKKVCYQCWQNGLLLICFAGNVLRIQPPLVITDAEIDQSLAIMDGALAALQAGTIPAEALRMVNGW
jgi:4-aminobutyrate aminotransferase